MFVQDPLDEYGRADELLTALALNILHLLCAVTKPEIHTVDGKDLNFQVQNRVYFVQLDINSDAAHPRKD